MKSKEEKKLKTRIFDKICEVYLAEKCLFIGFFFFKGKILIYQLFKISNNFCIMEHKMKKDKIFNANEMKFHFTCADMIYS